MCDCEVQIRMIEEVSTTIPRKQLGKRVILLKIEIKLPLIRSTSLFVHLPVFSPRFDSFQGFFNDTTLFLTIGTPMILTG